MLKLDSGVVLTGEFRQSENYKIAFVLTEKLLRDIVNTIEKNTVLDKKGEIAPFKFEVEMESGASMETDSIDDVLGLPNGGPKVIKELTVRASYRASPRFWITFSASRHSACSYGVAGRDKEVFYLSSQLEELIGRSRAWYSRVARVDATAILFGALLVMFVGLASVFR